MNVSPSWVLELLNVNGVAFSPDGTRVVSGGDGNDSKLWDTIFYKRDEDRFRERFAAPKPGWHREQVLRFEESGDLYAALFHRAWLLKINPEDGALYDKLHMAHETLMADQSNADLTLPTVVREMLQVRRDDNPE